MQSPSNFVAKMLAYQEDWSTINSTIVAIQSKLSKVEKIKSCGDVRDIILYCRVAEETQGQYVYPNYLEQTTNDYYQNSQLHTHI